MRIKVYIQTVRCAVVFLYLCVFVLLFFVLLFGNLLSKPWFHSSCMLAFLLPWRRFLFKMSWSVGLSNFFTSSWDWVCSRISYVFVLFTVAFSIPVWVGLCCARFFLDVDQTATNILRLVHHHVGDVDCDVPGRRRVLCTLAVHITRDLAWTAKINHALFLLLLNTLSSLCSDCCWSNLIICASARIHLHALDLFTFTFTSHSGLTRNQW